MDLSLWIQSIINGLALGWLYVLMALGLTLLLSIMGILQLAHGEIYMVGAYIVFFMATSFGINLYASIIISMVVMALVGIFLEKFLFRARPKQDVVLSSIVVSTGLTLILTAAATVGFGVYQRSIPKLTYASYSIAGAVVAGDRIWAIGFSVVALLALYLFLKRTKTGQAMVASAQNREGSFLKGINPNRMSRTAMMIACGLAALAGALAGSVFSLNPYMGSLPMIKGLVIIVLGGLGSIPGSLVGGLLLGLIDGIIPVVYGPSVSSIVPLVIVIILLLFRPMGLYGHE